MKRPLTSSATFLRDFRNWRKSKPASAGDVDAALALLAEDAAHPSLKTHKLKGEYAGRWACSAGYDLRIVFRFVEEDGAEAILLLRLGTHDEVY